MLLKLFRSSLFTFGCDIYVRRLTDEAVVLRLCGPLESESSPEKEKQRIFLDFQFILLHLPVVVFTDGRAESSLITTSPLSANLIKPTSLRVLFCFSKNKEERKSGNKFVSKVNIFINAAEPGRWGEDESGTDANQAIFRREWCH